MITNSLWRKIAATAALMSGFVLLFQATAFDSRYAARQAVLRETTALPAPGARLRFSATAYCRGTVTKSGVGVRTGIAAADPELLPVGSVVQADSLGERHSGIYTIMDTGPYVQGRHIDIYMWSCTEAVQFGRRPVTLTILRLGWSPRASSMMGNSEHFKTRERELEPRPLMARPLPLRTLGTPQ